MSTVHGGASFSGGGGARVRGCTMLAASAAGGARNRAPPATVGAGTNLGRAAAPGAAHAGMHVPPAAQTQHSPHPPLFTQSMQ